MNNITTEKQADDVDQSSQVQSISSRIITLVIMLIGLGLLIQGILTWNSWRLLDPAEIAQNRVDQEDGLSRQQQSQLYERQFDAALQVKGNLVRSGFLYIGLGLIALWVSRRWPQWPNLFSEQMLYGYAFLLPPIGWLLYYRLYPTRGDPNREIIRRNIGIMSLSLVIGGVTLWLISIVQGFILAAVIQPDIGFITLVGEVLSFGWIAWREAEGMTEAYGLLSSPQLAQFIAIFVGGYVALRTRDVRAIAVTVQLVVLAIVLSIVGWLGGNAQTGLAERGLTATDYDFLDRTAGFDISETLIDYDRSSTYGQAFFIGALNTIMVSFTGIALATILGLFVGISRLSSNWLVSTLARTFVELMRNVPLLVLLFFLYAGVFLKLPQREETLMWFGETVMLNNRGVALPWFSPTETIAAWYPFLGGGFLLGIIIWLLRNITYRTTGRPAFNFLFVILAFIIPPLVGIYLYGPLAIEIPYIKGLNYAKVDDRFVGLVMSPEFFGLLIGLVMYTGGYIGEVVRAGIQSVSKGQLEAAGALGLTRSQNLRLIIMPQALRVIIPPLTNQYLNLAKNSSLAIAIGYPDLYSVAHTTFNQSGQSVQVVLMILCSYLLMSLLISAVMNFINRQIQIKER